MTKKKDIEIQIEDTKKVIKGKEYEVTQLIIGKKVIGEILKLGEKEYQSFMNNEDLGTSRNLEVAIEGIIRQWNLHE